MRTLGMLVMAGLVVAAAGAPSDARQEVGSANAMAPPQAAGTNSKASFIAGRNLTPCETGDYFPLAPGNAWIYRGGGVWTGTFLTLEITQTQVFRGNRYFLLHGFPQQDYWLRETANGSVVAYDPAQSAEKLWWAFQSPLGQQYTTFLPGVCCGVAVVNSRKATYKGPVGEFDNALEILYPGVFQVGIARELFLPDIGLVYRNQATGGPSYGSWDLLYARVGATTVSAAPELSFRLTLDNSIYTANMMPPVPAPAPVMTARITLRNTGEPITLIFPSGQTFDFEIRNDKGALVYRWSDGQAFTMVFRTETFGPGEKNFTIQAGLAGADKNPLPQGKYVAEGWLTTQGVKVYDASVGFEIRWVH